MVHSFFLLKKHLGIFSLKGPQKKKKKKPNRSERIQDHMLLMECFLVAVPDRSAKTLMPVIKRQCYEGNNNLHGLLKVFYHTIRGLELMLEPRDYFSPTQ